MDQRTRRTRLAIAVWAASIVCGCGRNDPGTRSAAVPATQVPSAQSVEDEVLANIRNQPVGSHSVADFNIPEEFLRRIADRIIRASFVERHRIIVRDNSTDAPDSRKVRVDPPPANQDVQIAEVVDRRISPDVLATRQAMRETKPPLRGFRAAIGAAHESWPFDEPSDEPLRAAALIVGRRLAHDGLLRTTAIAIETLGHEKFSESEEAALDLLKQVGIPVDWLSYFSDPNQPDQGPQPRKIAIGVPSIVQNIAARLGRGESIASLEPWLQSLRFEFRASHPQFRAASESGEHDISLLRAQLSRGDPWLAEGDGGNVDLVLQTALALPNVTVLASIERQHLAIFQQMLSRTAGNVAARTRLVVEDLPVAQWAHDNGKAGALVNDDAQATALATLVPRYASRGDDGSTFVPGETFLLEGLAAADHPIIQSPLLFQGGNLLIVQHPKTCQRTLLLADAEVHRNTALGLTADQITRAFSIEFGVDDCLVLPVVSFHLDYDVTVRAIGDELVAFVNDPYAAAQMVLDAALEPLTAAAVIDQPTARLARVNLQRRQWRELMNLIAGPVYLQGGAAGNFPLSLAERFSTGPADSGVGNFQRVLQALDFMAAQALTEGELPPDPHLRGYLMSLKRMERQRKILHDRLRTAGFRVVEAPGLPDAQRAITYVNGIQTRTAYLMPSQGGLFASLDDAAAAIFQAQMGPDAAIVPIPSGESQRRSGAVHCSISAYPGFKTAVRPN